MRFLLLYPKWAELEHQTELHLPGDVDALSPFVIAGLIVYDYF